MAGITQPEEIKRYLQHVGEAYLPPSRGPPRYQAQELEFDIPRMPQEEPVIHIE